MKAECWRIDVFELWYWRRLLRVPWTANQLILKEITPEYSLKGLMLKLKAPALWPPDAKSWLTGKDPDAGKDWRQEEKGTTEDDMVGWHHWLNGHEFEQDSGGGEEQGGLACSPWRHKQSDTTEWRDKDNNLRWGGRIPQKARGEAAMEAGSSLTWLGAEESPGGQGLGPELNSIQGIRKAV